MDLFRQSVTTASRLAIVASRSKNGPDAHVVIRPVPAFFQFFADCNPRHSRQGVRDQIEWACLLARSIPCRVLIDTDGKHVELRLHLVLGARELDRRTRRQRRQQIRAVVSNHLDGVLARILTQAVARCRNLLALRRRPPLCH